jgi:putative addiction module component (TIGR02574 family)
MLIYLAISQSSATLTTDKETDMANSLPEIENDALRLPVEDRARLAVRLLESPEEEANDPPDEIEKLWLATAERRFQELHDGVVEGIPADKVFAELRSKYS